jgi:hypothetical protein
MQRNIMENDKASRQELHDISGMSPNPVEELLAICGYGLDGSFRACDHIHRCQTSILSCFFKSNRKVAGDQRRCAVFGSTS